MNILFLQQFPNNKYGIGKYSLQIDKDGCIFQYGMKDEQLFHLHKSVDCSYELFLKTIVIWAWSPDKHATTSTNFSFKYK